MRRKVEMLLRVSLRSCCARSTTSGRAGCSRRIAAGHIVECALITRNPARSPDSASTVPTDALPISSWVSITFIGLRCRLTSLPPAVLFYPSDIRNEICRSYVTSTARSGLDHNLDRRHIITPLQLFSHHSTSRTGYSTPTSQERPSTERQRAG